MKRLILVDSGSGKNKKFEKEKSYLLQFNVRGVRIWRKILI
jgi:hypothetical protein